MAELSDNWTRYPTDQLQQRFDLYTRSLNDGSYKGEELSPDQMVKWRQFAGEIHDEIQSRDIETPLAAVPDELFGGFDIPMTSEGLQTATEYGVPAATAALASIATGGAGPLARYGAPALAGIAGDYLAEDLQGEPDVSNILQRGAAAETIGIAAEKGLPPLARAAAAPVRKGLGAIVKAGEQAIEPSLAPLVRAGAQDIGLEGGTALTRGQQGSPEWLYYEAQRYDTKNPVAAMSDKILGSGSGGDRVRDQYAALNARHALERGNIGEPLDIGADMADTVGRGWGSVSETYGPVFEAAQGSKLDSRELRSEVNTHLSDTIADIRERSKNYAEFEELGLNVTERPLTAAFNLTKDTLNNLVYPIGKGNISEGNMAAAMVNLNQNLRVLADSADPQDAMYIRQLRDEVIDVIDTKFVPDDIGTDTYRDALKAWRQARTDKSNIDALLIDKQGNELSQSEALRKVWSARGKTKQRMAAIDHFALQAGDPDLINRISRDVLLERAKGSTTLAQFDRKIAGLDAESVSKYLDKDGMLERFRSWVAVNEAIQSLPNEAQRAKGGLRGGMAYWLGVGVAQPVMVRFVADILPKVTNDSVRQALMHFIKGGTRGAAYGAPENNQPPQGLGPILGGAL